MAEHTESSPEDNVVMSFDEPAGDSMDDVALDDSAGQEQENVPASKQRDADPSTSQQQREEEEAQEAEGVSHTQNDLSSEAEAVSQPSHTSPPPSSATNEHNASPSLPSSPPVPSVRVDTPSEQHANGIRLSLIHI